MAPRNGFIVKNAADAPLYLDEAEPDALDFNILGNHRYGVISGCQVALGTNWSVTVTAGTAVVDGAVVNVATAPFNLPLPSPQPRFDLITVDGSGAVWYQRGTPSPNPIFPEYPEGLTILAAVYVDPGNTSSSAANVTDKRLMLADRFKRALDGGVFLGSYASAASALLSAGATQWEVDFQGKQHWNGGSLLWESGPQTLSVHSNLYVEGDLTTGDDLVVGDTLTVNGNLTASNFRRGVGPPAGVANPSDIYQDTANGGVYTYLNGTWQVLATTPFQPGFIMPSLRDGAPPPGWLVLDGTDVDQAHAGALWDLKPQWRVSTAGGPRMRLPNFTGSYMRQGPLGTSGGQTAVTLKTENLPSHRHLQSPTGSTQPGGDHNHEVVVNPGGRHTHSTVPGQGGHAHPIDDPGHTHATAFPGGGMIAQIWGGPWRLDGPFNDASHPTAVGALPGVGEARTGVTIPGGGAHAHATDVEADHTHVATTKVTGSAHSHPVIENAVGGGVSFDNNPPYNCVNYLIKT